MADAPRKPGGFKVPNRTLVDGTWPQDPARAVTQAPAAPAKPADPMATCLEAQAPALAKPQWRAPGGAETAREAVAATPVHEGTADTARQAVPDVFGSDATADTARQAVPDVFGSDATADTARQAVPRSFAEATAETLELPVEALPIAPAPAQALPKAQQLQQRWTAATEPVEPPTLAAQSAERRAAPAATHGQPAPAAQHVQQQHASAHAQQQLAQQQLAQQRQVRAPAAQAQAAPPAAQVVATHARADDPAAPRAKTAPSADDAKAARRLATKARVLMDRGSYDEALSNAHKAMGIDGSRAEYAALCGYLVHLSGATASGLIDPCLALFDRAVALDPGHAGAHYYRGLVLEQAGRTKEAMAAFERALDVNPDHLEAARHLRDAGHKPPPKPSGGFGRLMKSLKR